MKREETLPEGWEIRTFEDLFDIQIGGTPKRSVDEYWDKERTTRNLWVSISDMSGLENKYLCDTKEYISDLGVRKSNVKPVPEGTILVSFKLTLGRLVIAGKPLFTNEAIAALHPKTDELSRDFLFYALQKTDYYEEVDRAVKGATLNKEKLKRLKVSVPHSLEQQQKIAAILSSLDDAIEKTGAVIHQLEVVNRGLMQRLLRNWKKFPLSTIVKEFIGGVSVKSEDRLIEEGEFGVLKVSAVSDGKFHPHEHKTIIPSELRRARIKPRADTVLISRSNTADLVGQCGYVDKNYSKVFLPDKLWQAEFIDPQHTSAKWFAYLLTDLRALGEFKRRATGTSGSMKNISKKKLLKIPAPIPPYGEQIKIANVLSSADSIIQKEKDRKRQLETIKKGLMQGLLSGRMGVKGG